MKNKVSVIIPTFNGERTIERAIKSVLNQTADCEIEILVCDDCSIDNTVKIAKKLGAKIIKNAKHCGGPNAGRNLGITKATGNLIAFLDQDDEWLIEKLEIQLQQIGDCDVVSSAKITRNE